VKFSQDHWVIIVLLLFTVFIAYWAARQQPVCVDPSAQPGLWDVMPWPVKLAVAQFVAALLLAMYFVSRRFVPPVPIGDLPATSDVDREWTLDGKSLHGTERVRGEYLASMAQLFKKARASSLACELLLAQFRRELSARLGLAPSASLEELTRALKSQRPALAERVQELFSEAQAIGSSPDEARVLRLGQRMAQLRKEWSAIA